MNLKDRWFSAYQGPTAIIAWDLLEKSYSEPHRYYHNFSHLEHCFSELDHLILSDEEKRIISLAIWFHDIVYDTHSLNNEEKSAQLFIEIAKQLLLPNDLIDQVNRFILETKYVDSSIDRSWLCDLFLDIDLSILGQSSDLYQKYTQQIKQEYSWVPQNIYNTKRVEILKRILNSNPIYNNIHLGMKYEVQAKINLAAEIDFLIKE